MKEKLYANEYECARQVSAQSEKNVGGVIQKGKVINRVKYEILFSFERST